MRQLILLLLLGFAAFHSASGQIPTSSVRTADLDSYTRCTFVDGLQIVQVDPLAPGVTSRSVQTAQGPRTVDMLAGERIMFAYPNSEFYANVKAEELPAEQYPKLKQALLDNLDYLLISSKGEQANRTLQSPINGLAVNGIDRNHLEGGVLGLYVMLDDTTHIATTIYFLNQEPAHREFQSMAEYAKLRDQFLVEYTACVRKAQN